MPCDEQASIRSRVKYLMEFAVFQVVRESCDLGCGVSVSSALRQSFEISRVKEIKVCSDLCFALQ